MEKFSPTSAVQQAALDQMWTAVEPFLGPISTYGEGGFEDASEIEKDIIKAALRLMSYEISFRISQRDTYVKCLVHKGRSPEEAVATIFSTKGHTAFFVKRKDIILNGKWEELETNSLTGRMKTPVYSTVTGEYVIVLPNEYKDAVSVKRDEIISELNSDTV